ncbi:MAG: YdcF family protein [Clostridiales bacterium]|nr:YdcF family protein [Clostridiales bacterium]
MTDKGMPHRREIRGVFSALFASLLLISVPLMTVLIGRFDLGTAAVLILSLCFFTAAFLEHTGKRWAKGIVRAYWILFAVWLMSFSALSISFHVMAARTAADGTENHPVLVVFGAGVNGETPSQLLSLRVRTAYGYLAEHPGALCVVTGGMGPGERITEAEAMRRTLVSYGIDNARILIEPHATDTFENAAYAMALIDENVPDAQVIAVSNAFHLPRCIRELEKSGAENVRTLAAPLPNAGLAVSLYIREYLAICYHALFG